MIRLQAVLREDTKPPQGAGGACPVPTLGFRCLLVLAAVWCVAAQAAAQLPLPLRNPSLEGPPRRAVPPPEWLACDSVSTPDTQPFPPQRVVQTASEGKGFMSLVCRGEYRDFMEFPTGTYEGAYQRLTQPLRAGAVYCLAMDLAFPGENSLNGGQTAAVARVFGGDDRGRRTELLWTSPAVGHLNWRTYAAYLRPRQTHASLVIECYFAQPGIHWGAIVVDNLRSEAVLPADLLGPDTTICLADSVLFFPEPPALSPGPKSYRRNDGSVSPTFAAKEAGMYWVEVWDGCVAYRDTVRIKTRECENSFFIPNVITPDSDGINDTFAFRGLETKGWQLTVADRWGGQVYASRDYRQDWGAEGLAAGVYHYRLEKPGFKPITGWLHVLR